MIHFGKFPENRLEHGVGFIQVLGNNPDIGQHRHVVGIASPARHNVQVQVVGNTSTGNLANIPADIETLSSATVTQDLLAQGQETMYLQDFVSLEVGKVMEVPVRDDQQMTVAVRVAVHDHKTTFTTQQHQPIDISTRIIIEAKHTLTAGLSRNVFQPPWSPKLFHQINPRNLPSSIQQTRDAPSGLVRIRGMGPTSNERHAPTTLSQFSRYG